LLLSFLLKSYKAGWRCTPTQYHRKEKRRGRKERGKA
jgi:hypothetical protein